MITRPMLIFPIHSPCQTEFPNSSIATYRLPAVMRLADQTTRHDCRGLVLVIRRYAAELWCLSMTGSTRSPTPLLRFSRNRNLPGWLLLGAVLQREVMPRAAYTLAGKQEERRFFFGQAGFAICNA